MKTIHLIVAACLPGLLLNACAPGKAGGSGGIGCSKTSSVLQTPTIRFPTESPFQTITEDMHRARFYKNFGANSNKSTGGYLHIKTRPDGKPFDTPSITDKRCSALVEFPATTGEVEPPNSSASTKFPSDTSAINAFRFPTSSSPFKIRIYTAAHCLDYSLDEEYNLSIFSVSNDTLPSIDSAYLKLAVKLPALEKIKELRADLIQKSTSSTISNSDSLKVMNAFRPGFKASSDNLKKIFGIPNDVTSISTPTEKQRCLLKPVDANAKQYSCATYHDMVLLDVELNEALTTEKETVLKAIRTKFVDSLKTAEQPSAGDVASFAKTADTGSILADYVAADSSSSTNFTRTIINSALGNPTFSNSLGCANVSSDFKLALLKVPTANACAEVPLDSEANLQFIRYISRERLMQFTRLNMVPFISELSDGLQDSPLNLQNCSGTSGLCSVFEKAKNAAEEATKVGFSSTTKSAYQTKYEEAAANVDALLSIWTPFFNAVDTVSKIQSGQFAGVNLGSADPFTLKMLVNPVKFINLSSNFVIEKSSTTNLPLPSNTTLPRAFLTFALQNIVGNPDFSLNGDTTAAIDNWTSSDVGNGSGKFLRFFSLNSTIEAFFSNFSSGGVSIATDMNGEEFLSVDELGIAAFNTKVAPSVITLQKGDSGSIFTLDGIPMFALSTVNGEPTSGGAAVSAIPVAGADTDDTPPGGNVADNGGTDGQPVASVGGKGGGAVCK